MCLFVQRRRAYEAAFVFIFKREITKAVTNKHIKNFTLLSCLAFSQKGGNWFYEKDIKEKPGDERYNICSDKAASI